MPMTHRSRLPPAEQRRLLAEQMRFWLALDKMTANHTAEAIARSRKLLAAPVYRGRPLGNDA